MGYGVLTKWTSSEQSDTFQIMVGNVNSGQTTNEFTVIILYNIIDPLFKFNFTSQNFKNSMIIYPKLVSSDPS